MFQNLYEKYRRRFPALLESLENARRNRRLAHAFLIHADLEETRREFAIVLAQLAACPHGEAGRPCSQCRVCRQLAEGSYPEFYPLTPIGKMYQIQVGDRTNPEPNTLRWFEERFFLTSTAEAECKIGVIYDADRMGDEAQNALLKTLEEPPRDTLLILATGNPAALLPTTLSRCQELLLLENRCEFNFSGSKACFEALYSLFFESKNDLVKAEAAAAALIQVAGGLNADAAGKVTDAWADRIEAAQKADPVFAKHLNTRQEAEADGACMKERRQFLNAIRTYASQLWLLSCGGDRNDLANPELYPENLPPVDPKRAELFYREAEELIFTLRFNVSEELALRTFAVNTAMK